MAKPGFQHHPKFKRLVYILREPVPHVWGYCECLWNVAYQNGDPLIGDSMDIELAAQYPGEPGKLTQALLVVRLIDEVEGGKFQIHDLHENAPDYVKKRFMRDQSRKNTYAPRTRRETRNSPPNSELDRPNVQNCTPGQELGPTHSTAQHSPAQPSTDVPPKAPRKRGAKADEVIAPGFAEFWQSYPRKIAKQNAIKAWNKLAPNEALRTLIHAALESQKRSPQWTKDKGHFVPFPATWLNGRRWEDSEVDAADVDAERFRRFVESEDSELFKVPVNDPRYNKFLKGETNEQA
jgi:hypothetical protein